MSIFDPIAPVVPDPIKVASDNVIKIITSQFSALPQAGLDGFNAIWSDQSKSAQIISSFGTNGVSIFELAQLNIETVQAAAQIMGQSPPAIPSIPSGWTLTPQSDGSMLAVPPPATPPTDLSVSVFSDGVIISWNEVEGALSYWLEKSLDGETWETIYSGQVQNSFLYNTGVINNQYRVRCQTAVGYSDYSDIAMAPQPSSSSSGN